MTDSLTPSNNKVPRHIGIILDGNRRFAKRLMLKPWKGHEWGRKKVEALLDWCQELQIKELTLYAFSLENFNRPKEEFNFLMNLFHDALEALQKDERIKKYGIHVRFIGRIHLFPPKVQDLMHTIMEQTKNNKNFFLNMAMAYGGRGEVIDAVRKIAHEVKEGTLNVEEINDAVFQDNLYMKSEPDLIIRTGGERRTSNFLPWQAAYSEWIFLEKTWPEFEKQDLVYAIQEFSDRERRFGH